MNAPVWLLTLAGGALADRADPPRDRDIVVAAIAGPTTDSNGASLYRVVPQATSPLATRSIR